MDQAQAPKKVSKARKKKVVAVPADDRPVTRIAFELEHNKKLSSGAGQQWIAEILIERGYAPDLIPAGKPNLVAWLEELLKSVPSADVMDAAKQAR